MSSNVMVAELLLSYFTIPKSLSTNFMVAESLLSYFTKMTMIYRFCVSVFVGD